MLTGPMRAPDPAPERAFTLVEIIVAAVIGLVVMAMVILILIQGRRSADQAIAGEDAARTTHVLSSTLASDVRGARAPGRDDVDDPIQLGELIAAGDPSVADIVAAGPDELRLVTRARATSAASCVWWRRDASGAITRAIYADLRCQGSATRTDRIGTVPHAGQSATGQPGVDALFAYGVLRDGDPSTGDPDKCTVEQVAAPTSLGSIIAIGARVDLQATRARDSRRQSSVDMTGIRSRDEPDYRAALGCAW
jgi:hypothetical protein